jgi:hypothetical protein
MRLFTSGRRTFVTLFSVAIVAVCLAAQPAVAQVAQHSDGVAPAMALPIAPAAEAENRPAQTVAPVLATESAARTGVARTEVRTDARAAAAAQPSDNTMRWGIILLIALAAAVLIVALAD